MSSVIRPQLNSQPSLPRLVGRGPAQIVQATAARSRVLEQLKERNVGEAILRRAQRITAAAEWIAASSSIDVFLAELQANESRVRSAWREEIE